MTQLVYKTGIIDGNDMESLQNAVNYSFRMV